MMEVSSLLSLPEGLRVEQRELQGSLLAMAVVSVRLSSCCPLCAQASSQVHSRDQRTLRDVACGGRKVVLHLSVRQFFCRNPDCARKVFSERLSPFVEPWAQVTTRLFEAVQSVGLATNGELGTRLADRMVLPWEMVENSAGPLLARFRLLFPSFDCPGRPLHPLASTLSSFHLHRGAHGSFTGRLLALYPLTL
jgi:hypothetical protein